MHNAVFISGFSRCYVTAQCMLFVRVTLLPYPAQTALACSLITCSQSKHPAQLCAVQVRGTTYHVPRRPLHAALSCVRQFSNARYVMSFSAAKPLLDDADLEEEAETYSNDGDAINPTDNQSFQLKPLVEMEVIGACRRGRRRGRRNRTQAERLSGAEQRRQSKNSRERRRVENVKNEYAKLQKILGLQDDENSSKEKGKYCKLRILNAAIDRIKELKEILRRADASLKEGAAAPTALPLTTSADLGVRIIM